MSGSKGTYQLSHHTVVRGLSLVPAQNRVRGGWMTQRRPFLNTVDFINTMRGAPSSGLATVARNQLPQFRGRAPNFLIHYSELKHV